LNYLLIFTNLLAQRAENGIRLLLIQLFFCGCSWASARVILRGARLLSCRSERGRRGLGSRVIGLRAADLRWGDCGACGALSWPFEFSWSSAVGLFRTCLQGCWRSPRQPSN